MEAGRVKFEGARDSSVMKRIAQTAELSVIQGEQDNHCLAEEGKGLRTWTYLKLGTSWRTFGLPRMCGCLLIALLRDMAQVETSLCHEAHVFLREDIEVRDATQRCCTGLQLPARLQQQ